MTRNRYNWNLKKIHEQKIMYNQFYLQNMQIVSKQLPIAFKIEL